MAARNFWPTYQSRLLPRWKKFPSNTIPTEETPAWLSPILNLMAEFKK
jgi:hypothetical protein